MRDPLEPRRLAAELKAVKEARETAEKHPYFRGVANARYVLRKVFRIVEEQAKEVGLDSIDHQCLIQIYGSPDRQLRIKELASRMDISQAFASNVARTLVEKRYVTRVPCDDDLRSHFLAITEAGIKLLCSIDDAVRMHVDYFTKQLSSNEREMTVYIMMFYVGL
jgi:DNA-binding MarR family transcriptional regulator